MRELALLALLIAIDFAFKLLALRLPLVAYAVMLPAKLLLIGLVFIWVMTQTSLWIPMLVAFGIYFLISQAVFMWLIVKLQKHR